MSLSNLQLKYLHYPYLKEIIVQADSDWNRVDYNRKRSRCSTIKHWGKVYGLFIAYHLLLIMPGMFMIRYS